MYVCNVTAYRVNHGTSHLVHPMKKWNDVKQHCVLSTWLTFFSFSVKLISLVFTLMKVGFTFPVNFLN